MSIPTNRITVISEMSQSSLIQLFAFLELEPGGLVEIRFHAGTD